MKTREIKELHKKDVAELSKMLSDARDSLFKMNLAKVQYKLKNTRELMTKRKDIARILTVLQMKETVVATNKGGTK